MISLSHHKAILINPGSHYGNPPQRWIITAQLKDAPAASFFTPLSNPKKSQTTSYNTTPHSLEASSSLSSSPAPHHRQRALIWLDILPHHTSYKNHYSRPDPALQSRVRFDGGSSPATQKPPSSSPDYHEKRTPPEKPLFIPFSLLLFQNLFEIIQRLEFPKHASKAYVSDFVHLG